MIGTKTYSKDRVWSAASIAIEIGNLSMRENLVITTAYACQTLIRLPVQTGREELQSATKLVVTLRPKGAFWRLTDFKRGKVSSPSPIPSMECCAAVQATRRKQQTPQL